MFYSQDFYSQDFYSHDSKMLYIQETSFLQSWLYEIQWFQKWKDKTVKPSLLKPSYGLNYFKTTLQYLTTKKYPRCVDLKYQKVYLAWNQ